MNQQDQQIIFRVLDQNDRVLDQTARILDQNDRILALFNVCDSDDNQGDDNLRDDNLRDDNLGPEATRRINRIFRGTRISHESSRADQNMAILSNLNNETESFLRVSKLRELFLILTGTENQHNMNITSRNNNYRTRIHLEGALLGRVKSDMLRKIRELLH